MTEHINFLIDRLYLMKKSRHGEEDYGIGINILAAECEDKIKNTT